MNRTSKSKGFALIISLALMALALLLMVTLSVILQVQIQANSQLKKEGVAKQNAMLGVLMALSDIQLYTGPDQRVTSRADLLDENADQAHWTGVWHSNPGSGGGGTFESGEPHWLVSTLSDTPNPINGILNDPVRLVNASTSGEGEVVVDRIPITSIANGDAGGSYAFWVGDEGIKVNMRVREPDAYQEISNSDYTGQINRLSMAHQPRWERLLGSEVSLDSNTHSKLQSLDQLELLGPDLPISDYFHDISAYSNGLLTNTAEGGMKRDLTRILSPGFSGDYPDSLPLVSGPGFPDPPTWGLLRSFYNSGNDTTLGTSWGDLTSPVNVRPHSFENNTHGFSPIVGMLQMNWGVRYEPEGEPDQHRIQVTIVPIITLVNPHNFALAPATYRLRVFWRRGNLDDLTDALLISLDSDSEYLDHDFRIFINQNLHGSHGIVFEISDVGFDPGEARIFSLDGQYHYRPGIDDPLPMEPGFNLINFATMDTVGVEYFLSDSERDATLRTRLRWGRIRTVTLNVEVADVFQEAQLIEWLIYNTTPRYNQAVSTNPPLNPIPNKVSLRHSNHGHTVSSDSDYSGARWLALYNPRARLSGRDRQNSSGSHSWVGLPLYDALAPQDVFTDHDGELAYWGSDTNPSGQHFVPLYDIPRIPMISLGNMQHANLSSRAWQPSYPFANSWASPYYEYNEEDISYSLNQALWDGYFFSGLDEGLGSWPAPDDWRNTRLRPLEDSSISDALVWDQAASNFTVQGAFNINSTSVPAWESLLNSLQGLSVPYNDPALGGVLESNFSDDETPFPRGSLSSAAGNTDWRGYRSLTGTEVNNLARAIVDEIRKRGPFRSLAAFVNRDLESSRGSDENLKGALQAAIDNTTINAAWATPAVPSTTDAPIDQYPEASTGSRSSAAPGYLTQADLLQVLGPVISPRSDTFRIRAYGNYVSPTSGVVLGEAWCEAIVQRMPDYLDPDDASSIFPPASVYNQLFGRKYVVIGLRWLESDEI